MTGHVAVVGTGTIGASWAAHLLGRGFDVVAWDPVVDESSLRATVDAAWPALEVLGLAPGASRDRLRVVADPADAADGAVFVQESGPEHLPTKHALVAVLDEAAPADTVVASSTSGLTPSAIRAGAPRHPERFLVGHPYNPPHLIPLVEVVGGAGASPVAIERAMTFYRGIGKRPVLIHRELPGHVANRLQVAVWREAFALVARGDISVEDLDAVMVHGPGLRWALFGPFLTFHAGGGAGGAAHMIDHLDGAMRVWADDLSGFPAVAEYRAPVLEGIAEALEGVDFADLLRRRDAALLEVLATRARAGLDRAAD